MSAVILTAWSEAIRGNPVGCGMRKVQSGWKRFLQDEHGSATIEFVIWVPGFMFLLLFATDATVLYLTHTGMWNVSRDVARRMSIGDLTDTQAVAVAQQELFMNGLNYSISATSGTDVVVTISVAVPDASIFGIFDSLLDSFLVARVVMRREPA